jgi:putative transposase
LEKIKMEIKIPNKSDNPVVGANLCVRPIESCGCPNKSFPTRKQLRLKDYDYSQNNAYYVTICTKDRTLYFEDPGIKEMITGVWNELQNKFDSVCTDEFIIMPNHIHGIIIIDAIVGQTHRSAPTLGDIVRWFKTMTTNYYIRGIKNNNWKPFIEKLWQRNYYEHIIRNEAELNRAREYIRNNPNNWETDMENMRGRR